MQRQANEDLRKTVAINKKIISQLLSAEYPGNENEGKTSLEAMIKDSLWGLELNLEKANSERD